MQRFRGDKLPNTLQKENTFTDEIYLHSNLSVHQMSYARSILDTLRVSLVECIEKPMYTLV